MATLNGLTVTSAVLTNPRWGIPTARVKVDTGAELTGQVTLELAGISFVGTVVPGRGGAFNDAGSYFIVGGLGGWSKPIPEASYRGPLTRLQTVVTDAARACGERVELGPDADRAVGPYLRFQGLASAVLEQLVPEGWWVDLDGTTRIAPRPTAAALVDPLDVEPSRAVAHVALENISALLPAATVVVAGQTREIGTVVHRLDESGLRSDLHLHKGGDRFATAVRSLVQSIVAPHRYFGIYEVRVVTQTGDTWDVEPVDKSLGLPPFPPVAARTSIPGLKVELELGAHLLVGFVNGNPARPYVAGFPGTADPGAMPAKVTIGSADGAPFIRAGDLMMLTVGSGPPAATPLVFASSILEPGPPGTGHARLAG